MYADECAACHSSNLLGNESPALIGDEFMAEWSGLTVGDLFERIRVTMPQDSPGRLSLQQYGDLVAFLLSSNSFPAGVKELDHDVALLKQIRWEKDLPPASPK